VHALQFSYSRLMRNYKLLNHTADIGIEVWGKTKKELFANAVYSLFDLMVDTQSIDKTQEKTITIGGVDITDLLINFLREALYLFNGKRWLVKKCKLLELTTGHVVAQLQGEPYNSQKHQLRKEIKAVTYHNLRVNKTTQGWKAKVIFDV
jgi:SHS2 domain-containing protein